jgi:hypothetical protein
VGRGILLPPVDALLQRAAEIDAQAWTSPLHKHLTRRRAKSVKQAFDELLAKQAAIDAFEETHLNLRGGAGRLSGSRVP